MLWNWGLKTLWIIVVRQGYHRVFLGSGSSRPRHLHPLSSLGGYCNSQGAVLQHVHCPLCRPTLGKWPPGTSLVQYRVQYYSMCTGHCADLPQGGGHQAPPAPGSRGVGEPGGPRQLHHPHIGWSTIGCPPQRGQGENKIRGEHIPHSHDPRKAIPKGILIWSTGRPPQDFCFLYSKKLILRHSRALGVPQKQLTRNESLGEVFQYSKL